MPKNVLISLKNCKNCQTLGDGKTDPLSSGGWGLCPQTPISVILHCKFFSLHLPHKAQTFLESTKRPTYFLVIIAGVHHGFQCRNYSAFRTP